MVKQIKKRNFMKLSPLLRNGSVVEALEQYDICLRAVNENAVVGICVTR